MPNSFPRLVVSSFDALLFAARAGSWEALGTRLSAANPYLIQVVKHRFGHRLKPKADPVDLVQETFIEAQRALSQFQGTTWPLFRSWLRCILLHNLSDLARYHTTSGRQIGREIGPAPLKRAASLPAEERSSVERLFVQEQLQHVRVAFAGLPEDYRRVLVLRLEGRHTFAEIGSRLVRTPEAARQFWRRALTRLRSEMKRVFQRVG